MMKDIVRNLNKKEKGFTLIELMIVVAIIGILAAIAIPQFGEFKKKAADAKSASDIGAIKTAEEVYYSENDVFVNLAVTSTAGAISGLTGASISKNGVAAVKTASSASVYKAMACNTKGTKVYAAWDDGTTAYITAGSADCTTTAPKVAATYETSTAFGGTVI